MTDDRDAVAQLQLSSTAGAVHPVLHYLYFPEEQRAAEAASQLRRLGFTTEERRGADGVNWLVLARHDVIPSDDNIVAARQLMEGLAATVGGEYDGWEAEVQRT